MYTLCSLAPCPVWDQLSLSTSSAAAQPPSNLLPQTSLPLRQKQPPPSFAPDALVKGEDEGEDEGEGEGEGNVTGDGGGDAAGEVRRRVGVRVRVRVVETMRVRVRVMARGSE